MKFDDFYGLDAQVERLRADFENGDAVHAYLFLGPHGTGKRSMAMLCAQALNCRAPQARPCGVCPSCKRFAAGTYPDYIEMRPEKKTIGVEEIRALIDRVSIKPFEGGTYAVLICEADKMTPQAQNALLKTLEDPPGSAVFFLLAERLGTLLNTIVSRCRVVHFHSIDESLVVQALAKHGIAAERTALLAHVARGSVGKAIELNDDKAYWAVRERLFQALISLKGPDSVPLAFATVKQDREASERIMEIAEGLGSDLMYVRETGEGPSDVQLRAQLEKMPFEGARLLSGVFHARQMLASNVSYQTAMEMLFFDLVGG